MTHTVPTGTADALIAPAGDLTGAAVTAWRDTLAPILGRGCPRLVIDLSHTPTIDADGIALLVDTHRRMISTGSQLIIRAPNPRIQRLFTLARVHGVLTVEPAEEHREPAQ